MEKFVIVTEPKLANVYTINFDTIAEFKELSEYTTPPAEVKIENYRFFNAEDTKKLFRWFTFGTVINGIKSSSYTKYWRYDYQSQPPQAFFKFCNANGISTTRKDGTLYSEKILNRLINIFNKKQIDRVYKHNQLEFDENIQAYAEFKALLSDLKFFYQPFTGVNYAIYENKYTHILQDKIRPTEEEEQKIVKLAKAYGIEIETEQVLRHFHRIQHTIHSAEKTTTTEYWREYTTTEAYEPIPQYSYQGQKSREEINHYKSRLKVQYNADSLRKAKTQIDFFKSLPLETQAEFLADNYKMCSHCQQPYNTYNGCDCGHTPPEETPLHLQYIENIKY